MVHCSSTAVVVGVRVTMHGVVRHGLNMILRIYVCALTLIVDG